LTGAERLINFLHVFFANRGIPMNTKVQTAIKGSVVVIAMLLATGCTQTKAQIEALETKVGMLEQQVASASSNASSAVNAAAAAQVTADEAVALAASSQACCDATNEKMDRMFQSSQNK
jgi:hypothetical protein